MKMTLREQLEREMDQTFGRLNSNIDELQDRFEKQEAELQKAREKAKRPEREFNFRSLRYGINRRK